MSERFDELDVSERYFETTREELPATPAREPDEATEVEAAASEGSPKPATVRSSGRRLGVRPLAEVEPRRVRWLLPGLIPLRALTLVAGVGGLGKSTWLAGVAARVSKGETGEPGDVLIVTFEDPAAEVLRPRVEAAQGDLERVHEVIVEGLDGIDPVRLPRDVGELERLVDETAARLLIVDPIVAAIDTTLDAYKDQDVRAVLARLSALAERADCAIALVGHLNKSPSREAYIRVANSVAFWNASRSVVLVTEDPDDEDGEGRLVSQSKANWARQRPVERHRIETVVLPGTLDPETGDLIETSRMVFVELVEGIGGGDVLGGRRGDEKVATATAFLRGALADGDWHDSAGLKTLAAASRISERTLKRAARELGVEHERRGFPASTYWRLAQSGRGYPSQDGPTELAGASPHGSDESEGWPRPVAPVGPAAPEEIGAGRNGPDEEKVEQGAGPILVPGDPGFPDLVDAAFQNGHLTEAEHRARRKLHAWLLEAGAGANKKDKEPPA